jgi:hypothetical protein
VEDPAADAADAAAAAAEAMLFPPPPPPQQQQQQQQQPLREQQQQQVDGALSSILRQMDSVEDEADSDNEGSEAGDSAAGDSEAGGSDADEDYVIVHAILGDSGEELLHSRLADASLSFEQQVAVLSCLDLSAKLMADALAGISSEEEEEEDWLDAEDAEQQEEDDAQDVEQVCGALLGLYVSG